MTIATYLRPIMSCFVGLLLTVAASAQSGISLSPDAVENFIESYPDVRASVDGLRDQYDVPDGGSASASMQAWAALGGAKSQLDNAVSPYGFADFTTWTQTFSAIGQAYAFAREGGSIDNQMSEALAKVRDNPNFSAAQKEMLLQQLQHSSGAIAAMRPSQQNIDAVAPYVDQLKAVFNDNR